MRTFECGFTDSGGETRRPCPSDPDFPAFGDYDILCVEKTEAGSLFRWTCDALPKTKMARLLHLPSAYGRTENEARRELSAQYEQRASPWMRPMGMTPSDE